MIIKKFTGKNESDATALAQKELGNNIVVMNTRNVKRKGFMRFFKPQLVEITVGLEEEQDRVQAIRQEANRELTGKEARESLQEAIKEAAMMKQKQEESEENALKERLDNLQNLLEKIAPEENAKEEDAEEEEKESDFERFIKLLYNTMIENEVNEKYANQIIDDLDKHAKPDMPIDTLLSSVYQKMILKFGEPCGIKPAAKGPKVVFFIGPTGVGKTTTIAKIASKFSIEQKKKIALLTADTYRIAAAEQLRTYANILEVPFKIIYTEEEIGEALSEFADYDYILVDTAGHSHHNDSQKDKMNVFIHSVDDKAEKEVYLVVSATTKYSDLVSIADSYSAMTEYKIIFTKLDETTTLGNILNLKLHTGAELAYITCGQNVPDDIEDFNPQRTVKLLLGGKK